ncbi:hypothetical protein FFLO_07082 [Filobasidium floriforme]|uniref:Ribosomal protein L19 n=1 Tax=Filobasidium floriforme TaxID=5210 RepID=A0A8K0JE64_9TREE|nr:hypothetical protein FFLO_07082 [Filobasidium floriforme]
MINSTLRCCRTAVRGMATASEASSSKAQTYPFSAAVTFPTSPSTSNPTPKNLLHPKNGKSVVEHVNAQLLEAYDPASLRKTLFSRRNPLRLKPGSVISVASYTDATKSTSTVFSGVLLGIGRKGIDTSFTLRNIVNRTGVEMKFKVHSPMIKKIEVIKEADGKGLKLARRAKVNYLRDKPGIMNQIAAAVKQTKVSSVKA